MYQRLPASLANIARCRFGRFGIVTVDDGDIPPEQGRTSRRLATNAASASGYETRTLHVSIPVFSIRLQWPLRTSRE
jgi:hypothetical protein